MNYTTVNFSPMVENRKVSRNFQFALFPATLPAVFLEHEVEVAGFLLGLHLQRDLRHVKVLKEAVDQIFLGRRPFS